ncbi:hypothetical protein DV736_g5908, partial [Chaetothyriales sp. CBS 134916]
MVNLSKRMSILQPKLLDLRHGKGAHVLPPAPVPQLVHVFLRYPRRQGLKPDARTDGAHQFGSRYLPRLKYHNPKLKVDIKTDGNTHAPMKLVLQFEGTDPAALRAIAKKSIHSEFRQEKLKQQQQQEGQEDLEAEARQQSPNWRDAPAPKEEPLQEKGRKKPTADEDEVVVKERPESGLGLHSNTPVYSRSVTLKINSKSHWEIWQWFKRRTGVEAVPMTDADSKLWHKINKDKQQAESDRKRSLVAGAQLRQERAALEKAKKAAEQMLAE